MKLFIASAALACALSGATIAARAQGTDWVVKVGVHSVDPKFNNGTLAAGALKTDVGSDVKPTITAEYLLSPEWGVEALASLPWEHEVKLNGAKAATTKQLPPTLSLQYHFNPGGQISPFVGLGLNYTIFFSEHTTGPLAGTKLSLDNTLGRRCTAASISASTTAGWSRPTRAGSRSIRRLVSTARKWARCTSIRSSTA